MKRALGSVDLQGDELRAMMIDPPSQCQLDEHAPEFPDRKSGRPGKIVDGYGRGAQGLQNDELHGVRR